MIPMRVFLEACGLSSPLTLECDDPGLPAAALICHEHGLPFVVVGRDPRANFQLNDPLISRRHAYLQVIAGRIFCIDLDSRSQIRWEGARIPRTKRWLEQEQFIWLGRYRIRWRGRLGKVRKMARCSIRSLLTCSTELKPINCPKQSLELPIRIGENPSTWTIGSRLSLIGRSAECQLVLTDNSISTYHASLVRTPLGIWVVDLLSREGVWVNGTRVRWAWLDDGDTMRIGRFTFILRYRSLPDQISRRDVPLDAGAILSQSPVATAGNSAGLPVQVAKPLARRSSQSSRLRTQLEPHPLFATPPVAANGRDLWNPGLEFAGGPSTMWNQHVQFLEMLHSEMILMVRMFMTMHREHVGSIRDEFDRVQQLTRELETLQAKLGGSSNAANVDPPAGIERRGSERHSPVKPATKTSIAGFSLGRSRREPRAPQLARPRRERAATETASAPRNRLETTSRRRIAGSRHRRVSRDDHQTDRRAPAGTTRVLATDTECDVRFRRLGPPRCVAFGGEACMSVSGK